MTAPTTKLYLISFGNLINPSFYTNYLEPVTVGVFLMAPRLQGTDLNLELLTRLGAVPLYVLLFVAIWMLRRGDIVFKNTIDKDAAAADKLLAKMEAAHAAELAAVRVAHERERQQYEERLTSERNEKEAWKRAWADTIPLAQQGVSMAQQLKVVP